MAPKPPRPQPRIRAKAGVTAAKAGIRKAVAGVTAKRNSMPKTGIAKKKPRSPAKLKVISPGAGILGSSSGILAGGPPANPLGTSGGVLAGGPAPSAPEQPKAKKQPTAAEKRAARRAANWEKERRKKKPRVNPAREQRKKRAQRRERRRRQNMPERSGPQIEVYTPPEEKR